MGNKGLNREKQDVETEDACWWGQNSLTDDKDESEKSYTQCVHAENDRLQNLGTFLKSSRLEDGVFFPKTHKSQPHEFNKQLF